MKKRGSALRCVFFYFLQHLVFRVFLLFFLETKRNEKGNRTTLHFLDALFKDAEDGKTNARMNAEIKRERERERELFSLSLSLFFLLLSSFVASLHFLTARSVRVC
jgi:hypothetical protein